MRSSYVGISRQKVHYLEAGSGKTVIMLPSHWLTSRSFTHLGEELTGKYRVIIPDLYKGKSDFSAPARSLNAYCEALHEFMGALGIHKAYLIGVSYGGFVTSYFAQRYPECVERLVILSSTALPFVVKAPYAMMVKGYIRIFRHLFLSFGGRSMMRMFMADALAYLRRHPWQFLHEMLIALQLFNKKHPEYQDYLVRVMLYPACHDEFIGAQTIAEANRRDKNIRIEEVDGIHGWFFLNRQRFLSVIDKAIG